MWLSLLPLFFPLYLVRFDVGGVPTTLLEWVVGLTAVWGLVCHGGRDWLKTKFKRRLSNPLWPVLLFLLAATISVFIVPVQIQDITDEVIPARQIALGIWKGWIVMPIVYFLMVFTVSKDAAWWLRSKLALVFSGVALSLWALFQMGAGEYLTTDGRASGPFESANYLALYLAPIVLLAGVNAVESFRKRQISGTILGVLMVVILGLALWGTQSYASFLALAAGVVFYAFFHPDIPRRYKRWGIVGGVVVLVGFFLTQANTIKFKQFLDFEARSSSSVRIEVYEIATDLIREHPVLGIGLGHFNLQYRLNAHRLLGHLPYEWVMIHPHNLFLALWLNTGLLGMASMGWLMVLAFRRSLFSEVVPFEPRTWRGSLSYSASLLGLSMLVVILVHGLFDTPFFKNDLAYLWWWVMVLVSCRGDLAKSDI